MIKNKIGKKFFIIICVIAMLLPWFDDVNVLACILNSCGWAYAILFSNLSEKEKSNL